MGEIFHGQTKGYMFACDQLHDINISIMIMGFKGLLDFSQICQIHVYRWKKSQNRGFPPCLFE